MKTIDDCTRDDIAELAESSIHLLTMSMFYYWLNVGEQDEDQSWRHAIERMRATLERCGLPQPTYEEYRERLKETLHLSPEEFLRRLS